MKKMKWLSFIALIVSVVFLYQTEGVQNLLNENVEYFTEELREEVGYNLLWITIPLAALQGVITIFPFLLIIVIHISSFGLIEGIFFSWLGSFLGAVLCFILARYFFSDFAEKRWDKKKNHYEKLLPFINLYGIWLIIFLRSIPIIPSNIISIMAALSPIGTLAYLWSSFFGNISMVWLLTLLSFPVTLPHKEIEVYITSYILFSVTLLFFFYRQQRTISQKNKYIPMETNNKIGL